MKFRIIHRSTNRSSLGGVLLMLAILLASSLAMAQDYQQLRQLVRQSEDLGLNQQHVAQLMKRSEQQGIPEDQLADLLQPAINSAENGLPAGILLRKSLEGLAKNIPAHQIQQVLTRMGDDLSRAASVVDPWMDNPEVQETIERESRGQDISESARNFRNIILEGFVEALFKNVRDELLDNLLKEMVAGNAIAHLGSEQVSTAIRVFPDLPTTANNPEMSNRILIKAMSAGFDISELRQLPSAMHSAQQHSQLPAEAVAEGLNAYLGRGVPASDVIRNLLQGNIGPPGFVPPGLDRRPDRGRPDQGRPDPGRPGQRQN